MIMIPVHRGTATSPCTLFRVPTSHTAEPQVTAAALSAGGSGAEARMLKMPPTRF